MKWSEYIIARTALKLIDEADRRRKKEEVRRIKNSEEKFDKGYWKYDFTQEEYLFVQPKKNEHFVTSQIKYDGKTCKIILSRKPKSLESKKFDYPWDAEYFCRNYADIYRAQGYKIIIKREAPVLIFDYDICCPFCFNSSPLQNWAENSYKQELFQLPKNYKKLTVHIIKNEKITINDIKTEKVWCPICNNGIADRKILMTKGDEWKTSIIKNTELPKYASAYSQKIMKEQEIVSLEKRGELNIFKVNLVVNKDRKLITNPAEMVTDNAYGGLVAKVFEKITTKNGDVLKTKWIHMKNNIPSNCELTKDISTSYAVSFDLKTMPKWITKRDKNSYHIRYVPLSELIIRKYIQTYENEILQKEISKFHAGELLDFIEINSKKEILNNYVLVQLAYELGLSHVPVMVIGGYVD